MITEQIAAIRAKLQGLELTPAQRDDLERLLNELSEEAALLPQSDVQSTPQIASEEPFDSMMNDLRNTVSEFESTHPKLSGLVGQIATTLSNMGI